MSVGLDVHVHDLIACAMSHALQSHAMASANKTRTHLSVWKQQLCSGSVAGPAVRGSAQIQPHLQLDDGMSLTCEVAPAMEFWAKHSLHIMLHSLAG